jgi:hypothetical protein
MLFQSGDAAGGGGGGSECGDCILVVFRHGKKAHVDVVHAVSFCLSSVEIMQKKRRQIART